MQQKLKLLKLEIHLHEICILFACMEGVCGFFCNAGQLFTSGFSWTFLDRCFSLLVFFSFFFFKWWWVSLAPLHLHSAVTLGMAAGDFSTVGTGASQAS